MKNICCIYKITSPDFNIYIGQTINLRQRICHYKNFIKLKSQKKLKDSFLKHGFENHKIEILIECSHNELNFWEEFYVALFNSFKSEHGLNLTSGGRSHKRMQGVPKSEEWKSKMSKIKSGKKRGSLNEEWRYNIGIASKISWNNRKEKGETLRKSSQIENHKISIKEYFKTDKGKEHLILMQKKTRERLARPIIQYSMDGVIIKKWECTADAERELKIPSSNIINCLNGNKYKSAGGFIWKRDTKKGQIKK